MKIFSRQNSNFLTTDIPAKNLKSPSCSKTITFSRQKFKYFSHTVQEDWVEHGERVVQLREAQQLTGGATSHHDADVEKFKVCRLANCL